MHGRQMKSSNTNHLSESKQAFVKRPDKHHLVAQQKLKNKQVENLHQMQLKDLAAQKKAVQEMIEQTQAPLVPGVVINFWTALPQRGLGYLKNCM